MSSLREKRIPVAYDSGMYPIPDTTQLMSTRVVDGDRIRFNGGSVWQIGGWVSVKFDQLGQNQSIDGCARMLFSFIKGNDRWYIIGTSTGLYSLLNSALTNITPLSTDTTAMVTDPFSSIFLTSSNPFRMTNGSQFVKIESGLDSSFTYAGQVVKIANVSGTIRGVPASELNGFHTILYYDSGYPIISVTTAATSSGTGGGASIDQCTAGILVQDLAHGMTTGMRIKISGSTGVANIPDTEINGEHIINVVDDDTYIFTVSTYPTSQDDNGGAAVERQAQIDSGSCDNAPGAGYGMGLYGVGLYGVSKNAYNASNIKELRLWSADRFGNNILLTPGNQTPLYEWTVDTDVAPAEVTGDDPPTTVNYTFVTDNFLCVLGPDGVENKVRWASQGTSNIWTPDADNTAASNTLRDAGRLISHLNVRGTNLIFSQNLVYTMRFIQGSDYVFQFTRLDGVDGIMAQNARASHKGIGFWVGNNSFNKYDGGIAGEIGDANDENYITIKQYFFERLSTNQRQKVCCGIVREYNEWWILYPSQDSTNEHGYNENDSYIIHDISDGWWAFGSLPRTAIEYPAKVGNNQYMIGANNTVYAHEMGVNDDTGPMNAYADLRIAMAGSGDDYLEITGFMADAIITGNLKVTYFTKRFPLSPDEVQKGPYTVTATSDLKRLRAYGRQRKIRVATDEVDSTFQLGAFYEYAKTGGQR